MNLFFKLVLYFIPAFTYYFKDEVGILKNDTEITDKEYNMVVFSYGFLSLSFITTIIIKKFNLSPKFCNRKLEIFNYSTIGEVIFLFSYIVWWLGLLSYAFLGEYKGQIMTRLGNWIILNLSCTLFPIARNSIFSILLGLSHHKLLYLHRILSILCIVSVIIK